MLNLKSTLEKSQVNLPEPKSPSLALLDFGKHLKNLKFEVGEKMKNTTLETIGPQKTTRERIPVRPQPLVLGNPPFAKLLAGSLEAHRKSTSPWPRAINNI
ncbi:uncharacterized protein LOC103398698 [Cynoglossus semilaevis]|uniref:uncharacterized protein LOC103398698 n=1 Tax=Cynoglossus semilaevis TaxID=244447 RepID=UPI000D630DB4|nr:uncharacterized protein LOC103398698 [Cynoglossus semilaevis]